MFFLQSRATRYFLACLACMVIGLFKLTDAEAKPKCWPKQLGSTGSDFKTGETPEGVRWIAWTCTQRGVTTLWDYAALPEYKLKHPANVAGLSPIKTAEAYLAANLTPLTEAEKARIAPARAAASAAFGFH